MIRPIRSVAMVWAGEALPVLEKTFTAVDLMAYGAATWDWHRLHYDIEFARAMKLPNVVIDGQVFGALFARAVVDWAGPQAFVACLSFKMKSMAFAGETLRVEGEVTQIAGSAVIVAQRLTSGHRLVSEAKTEVRLPAPTSPVST
ncbi:MaoC/PaaZ C-terminal domain-containing protein [Bradyrhizobium brasilense]|uniref:MaoC/PaaZ C-terminal domain-containing protein n=1 Tax=Bradyrhizobium brasilense TaxID=1419277 RepID=UPI0024B0FB11|nr:MaoC/PaaZ C-terminal domain-containing protein [Bradyrhizobium australafricanum]WFU31416.1 MaoC/PaaZ C-terminal domain-containing protein [Bradyrhizobium australafricanum]